MENQKQEPTRSVSDQDEENSTMLIKMSSAQRLALHSRGAEIASRLYDVAGSLPEGYDTLKEAAIRLHAEFIIGHESELFRDLGYLVLQLARPVIAHEMDTRSSKIADLIDVLYTKIACGIPLHHGDPLF